MSKHTQPKIRSKVPLCTPSNDYAISWACTLTDPSRGFLSPEELNLLSHVNCSYLSSGKPPTLLALKQHAQALAILIKKLSVTDSFGIVNASASGNTPMKFNPNEAYDWLNNLEEPYDNDDEAHSWPLWAIANQVKSEHEIKGIEYYCPMQSVRDFGSLAETDGVARPYRTHHNVLMHANECLEILDHEYSATGGLLSLLPADTEQDTKETAGIRNSLIGQWLVYTQHLVARMHELEINYANALDLLAGEAIVPAQKLHQFGSDARLDRPIVVPQDRFILANCSGDIADFLHRKLDQIEAQTQEQTLWKDNGVSGERLWSQDRHGVAYSRGLVEVEFTSRFYRIKGHGHDSAIFVLPAVNKDPAISATRKLETRPTVVSVVTPTWPVRVSELEQKFKEQISRLEETEIMNRALVRERAELRANLDGQSAELRRARDQLSHYEKNVTRSEQSR